MFVISKKVNYILIYYYKHAKIKTGSFDIFIVGQKGLYMHDVNAKGILSQRNGMNLYRGCSHGCIYCDSRSICYGFTHDFEDIEVKQNAPELLEATLRSKRRPCMIGTGAMCDP